MSYPYNDPSAPTCPFCSGPMPEEQETLIAYTPSGSFAQESYVCKECALISTAEDPERCKLVARL